VNVTFDSVSVQSAARPVRISQNCLVFLPAATYAPGGRISASTNANRCRANRTAVPTPAADSGGRNQISTPTHLSGTACPDRTAAAVSLTNTPGRSALWRAPDRVSVDQQLS
jgi:hypothetical protein